MPKEKWIWNGMFLSVLCVCVLMFVEMPKQNDETKTLKKINQRIMPWYSVNTSIQPERAAQQHYTKQRGNSGTQTKANDFKSHAIIYICVSHNSNRNRHSERASDWSSKRIHPEVKFIRKHNKLLSIQLFGLLTVTHSLIALAIVFFLLLMISFFPVVSLPLSASHLFVLFPSMRRQNKTLLAKDSIITMWGKC